MLLDSPGMYPVDLQESPPKIPQDCPTPDVADVKKAAALATAASVSTANKDAAAASLDTAANKHKTDAKKRTPLPLLWEETNEPSLSASEVQTVLLDSRWL